jgi:hypothetical protein
MEGDEVWCRVEGDELVIVGHGPSGLTEVVRHRLSKPGHPRILDEHYPGHPGGNGPRQPKPRPTAAAAEVAFLALGEGAQRWLVEAAATGAQRVRSKMAKRWSWPPRWASSGWNKASGWPPSPGDSTTATSLHL